MLEIFAYPSNKRIIHGPELNLKNRVLYYCIDYIRYFNCRSHELLFEINESNPSQDFLDSESEHKPENTCFRSSEESSWDEISFKKNKE